jgi:MoxR-like ATPase
VSMTPAQPSGSPSSAASTGGTSPGSPAAGTAAGGVHDPMALVRSAYDKLRTEIHKIIVGQDEVVEQVLMAIFCRGHAVVVGVPGLAKTLLISTIAKSLSLQFNRIQFTPDLMPSDITGTEVIQEDKTTGERKLRFVKGPIFANVILADEINRTPPKTQAALLESMQEHHVTIGGTQHALPSPFFVLATQNPIEQEGTYPLPEAQQDRFMFQIQIGYPSADEELEIVRRSANKNLFRVTPVLGVDEITAVQDMVRQTPVADHVIKYALRLVRATRVNQPGDTGAGWGVKRPKMLTSYLQWGAGPRASEFMVMAAKAKAILSGSTHVTPDHIKAVAKPILRHRLMLNYSAEADGVTPDRIVENMLAEIPVEAVAGEEKRQMDAVMR